MPASVTAVRLVARARKLLDQDRRTAPAFPSKGDHPAGDRHAQSEVSRLSRRVSSAATTSASASSRASRGVASSTRPIGVAASTSVPGVSAHAADHVSGGAPGCPSVARPWRDPLRARAVESLDRCRRRGSGPGAGSLEDPVVGWSASLGVTLLALFLRLWNLGRPRSSSSTRPTTRRTRGRCSTSATRAGTSTAPTTRSSTAPRRASGRRPVDGGPPRLREMADQAPARRRSECSVRLARGRRRLPTVWRCSGCCAGLPARPCLVAGPLCPALDGLELVLSRLALSTSSSPSSPLCRRVPRRGPGTATAPSRAAGPGAGDRPRAVDAARLAAGHGDRGLATHGSGRALTDRGVACGGRGAPAPAVRSGALGRHRGRRAAFVHLVLVAGVVYTATWTGWRRRPVRADPVVDGAHQFVKEWPCTGVTAPSNRRQRQALADRQRAGRARARRGGPVAPLALVLPQRLHLPHPLPELRRTPTRKPSGWPLLNRSWGSRPTPASSPAPAAAMSTREQLSQAGAAHRHPNDRRAASWRRRTPWPTPGRRAGLAVRRGRAVSTRLPVAGEPRSSICRPREGDAALRLLRHWTLARTSEDGGVPRAARPLRGRARRLVFVVFDRAELRVVLADLHRPAPDPLGVAGAGSGSALNRTTTP